MFCVRYVQNYAKVFIYECACVPNICSVVNIRYVLEMLSNIIHEAAIHLLLQIFGSQYDMLQTVHFIVILMLIATIPTMTIIYSSAHLSWFIVDMIESSTVQTHKSLPYSVFV